MQYTSCITMTMVRATSGWQRALSHQEVTGDQCTSCWIQVLLWITNSNLTKNGVILFHGDVPFQYLHVKEQIPTIACNVVHQGRGHSLPPSVTGGSWHTNTTWKHVMKEKGPTFIPGYDICDEIRITAWEFMGQQVPQNYGRLVFGTPLCNEKDFDPIMDSIYGAAAESS